jgi:hypothetical protein
MKIATITFGYSQNLGALLQTYALREYIESLGHQCDIIKFKNFDNRPFETIKGIKDGVSDILYFFDCKKKIKKINLFREKYLHFTDKHYYNTEEMKELNSIYDAFIAGSDQIWNVHKGIVDEFFLSFADDASKKIAYSASFGLSKIPRKYAEGVKVGLSRFDNISVRESTGVKIAKELTGKEYKQTLDPVFLKSADEWETLCGERKIKEKYIFVYPTQITKELTKTVRVAKKQYGIKVYSLFDFIGVDKVVKDADPIDFLNYIKNAELIIASSFHATAFSIIFNKNLRVVPHSSTGSRVVDLLNDLKLSSNCIIDTNNLNFDKFSYNDVNEILKNKIKFSKDYIRSSIN